MPNQAYGRAVQPNWLRVSQLEAELDAMNLWDRLLAQNPEPSQIEKDAGRARWFRRFQVVQLLSTMLETTTTIQ
jgi:hypothetical protein